MKAVVDTEALWTGKDFKAFVSIVRVAGIAITEFSWGIAGGNNAGVRAHPTPLDTDAISICC